MDEPTLEPLGMDRPNAARMYDYFLGGSHNFAVDRVAAEAAIAGFPGIAHGMRANRAFLHRVVSFLLGAGIDQFLDLGSGIPTVGNVHEVAQQIKPTARVVYVDIEAIAVEHSRQLLAGNPYASVVQADLRKPAEVLNLPEVRDGLDLSRPVGLLIIGTMHFIPDEDDPPGIVRQYRDAIAPGSYIALTNGTDEGLSADQLIEAEKARAVYARSPTPLTLRGSAEFRAMLDGLELVEPGLVDVQLWRPVPPVTADQIRPFAFGAVGRKP
jgi:hypothetical protein